MKKTTNKFLTSFLFVAISGLAFQVAMPNAWAGPLHKAINKRDIAMVKQLIKRGADVNTKSRSGHPPFSWRL